MKIALVADIHANYPALVKVLKDAHQAKAESLWVLGDVLGRGPLPVSCINLLDEWNIPVWLTGNHDRAALSFYDGEGDAISNLVKGQEEIAAVSWHAAQLYFGLDKSRIDRLREAPTWMEACERVYVSHGAIISADPMDSKNIGSLAYALPYKPPATEMLHVIRDVIKPVKLPHLLIFGHTHTPAIAYPPDWNKLEFGSMQWRFGLNIEPEIKYEVLFEDAENQPWLICPGSVGDVRGSESLDIADYALLEIKDDRYVIEFRRVKYNLGEFRAAMTLISPKLKNNDAQIELKRNWFTAVQKLIQQIQQDISDEHGRHE